jgi:hypothetical protein
MKGERRPPVAEITAVQGTMTATKGTRITANKCTMTTPDKCLDRELNPSQCKQMQYTGHCMIQTGKLKTSKNRRNRRVSKADGPSTCCERLKMIKTEAWLMNQALALKDSR